MTASNEREKFITELYTLYAESLDRHCRAYVAYAPEYDGLIAECVQETFLSAFSRYEALKDHPNPRGWLIQTCHHRLLNALRKARRARKHEAFSLDQQAEEPEEQTLSSVERWLANEAAKEYEGEILSLLTGQEQAAYTEYFKKGKSIRRIAEETGKSEAAVKSSVARIRKKIRLSKIFTVWQNLFGI